MNFFGDPWVRLFWLCIDIFEYVFWFLFYFLKGFELLKSIYFQQRTDIRKWNDESLFTCVSVIQNWLCISKLSDPLFWPYSSWCTWPNAKLWPPSILFPVILLLNSMFRFQISNLKMDSNRLVYFIFNFDHLVAATCQVMTNFEDWPPLSVVYQLFSWISIVDEPC